MCAKIYNSTDSVFFSFFHLFRAHLIFTKSYNINKQNNINIQLQSKLNESYEEAASEFFRADINLTVIKIAEAPCWVIVRSKLDIEQAGDVVQAFFQEQKEDH